jgi:hypothetical protein
MMYLAQVKPKRPSQRNSIIKEQSGIEVLKRIDRVLYKEKTRAYRSDRLAMKRLP